MKMSRREIKYCILAGIMMILLVQIYLHSDARYNAVSAPKIQAYLAEAPGLKEYRDPEGDILYVTGDLTDERPTRDNFHYRAIALILTVKLRDDFEKLSPKEQMIRIRSIDQDLKKLEKDLRISTGYQEALDDGNRGRGEWISDYFDVSYRSAHYDYRCYWSSFTVTVPGTYGQGKTYEFSEKNGEILNFRERKYTSSGGSGATKSGSSSGKSSSGKSASSAGRTYYHNTDPYDVDDYDDPDDFAEEWAKEFGDGDYDGGYDDAYDYWEENH